VALRDKQETNLFPDPGVTIPAVSQYGTQLGTENRDQSLRT